MTSLAFVSSKGMKRNTMLEPKTLDDVGPLKNLIVDNKCIIF